MPKEAPRRARRCERLGSTVWGCFSGGTWPTCCVSSRRTLHRSPRLACSCNRSGVKPGAAGATCLADLKTPTLSILTKLAAGQVALLPPPPPPLAGAVQPQAGAQTPGAAPPAGAAAGPHVAARSPLHLQARRAATACLSDHLSPAHTLVVAENAMQCWLCPGGAHFAWGVLGSARCSWAC